MVLGLSLSGSVRTAIPDSLSPVYGPIHYYVAFSRAPADRYTLAGGWLMSWSVPW